MEIQWHGRSARACYEDMVAVLIKRLHPTAQRIDGSGGDGGRDVQVVTEDGLLIYELKSFTGRLTSGGRKTQISRSLTKASAHDPAGWRLVLPIDPTPAELAWFEQITENQPFPCEWRGQTWLNSELASRPEIARYFLEDHRDEVLRLLGELRDEQAVVNDALAAIQRARSIRQRLNDLDPHYAYALSIGASAGRPPAGTVMSVFVGSDRVDVVARYATAPLDRPITIDLELRFDAESRALQASFERSLDFGYPVQLPPEVVERVSIDAPAGLSAEITTGASLEFRALARDLDEPAIVHVSIVAPDGETVLGTHEFTLERQHGGRRGIVLSGNDVTGLLSIELRLTPNDQHISIDLTFSGRPVLPSSGRTATSWMEQIRPPHALRLAFIRPSAGTANATIGEAMCDPGMANVYAAFEAIQQRCSVSFAVPEDLTPDECRDALQVAAWLRPEKRHITWSQWEIGLALTEHDPPLPLLDPGGTALFMAHDVSFEFRDRILPLGRLARTLKSVRTTNADAVRDAVGRGVDTVTLELAPASSDDAVEWLLDPEDPLGQV